MGRVDFNVNSHLLVRSAQQHLCNLAVGYFGGEPMSCKSCSSGNLRNFATEIALHLKAPRVPHVFVFPEVLVCLDCGFSELVIEEEDQLKVLAKDTITGGTKKMGTRSRALSKTSNPSQPDLSFGVQGRKNRTGEFY